MHEIVFNGTVAHTPIKLKEKIKLDRFCVGVAPHWRRDKGSGVDWKKQENCAGSRRGRQKRRRSWSEPVQNLKRHEAGNRHATTKEGSVQKLPMPVLVREDTSPQNQKPSCTHFSASIASLPNFLSETVQKFSWLVNGGPT